jgi:hypothetical protein
MPDPEQGWDAGWEGHRRAQLRRWAKLPLEEKLEWLEEAQRLAADFEESRQQARADRVREKPAPDSER